MILTLHIHYTRVSDLISPDHLLSSPPVPIVAYRDGFGNWCSRVVAPKGAVQFTANALINDPGTPDVVAADAEQHDIQSLPDDTWYFCSAADTARPTTTSTSLGLIRKITHRVGPRAGDL